MIDLIKDGSDNMPPNENEGAIHIIRGRTKYAAVRRI